jgi:hypothetical protein
MLSKDKLEAVLDKVRAHTKEAGEDGFVAGVLIGMAIGKYQPNADQVDALLEQVKEM